MHICWFYQWLGGPVSKIDVAYVSPSGTETISREISGTSYRFENSPSKETLLRTTIAKATGREKDVLQDLYRWLVLSNFAKLEGKGGKTARDKLDELYPAKGTLPEFKIVSGRFNATGAIIYNIETHRTANDGYDLLSSFLLGLLKAGFDAPRCEAIAKAETPTETAVDLPNDPDEKPPEYLPMG
jgi:hypothetical protein